MGLKKLDSKQDMLLLLDFRGENWELWEKFCEKHGYEAELKD